MFVIRWDRDTVGIWDAEKDMPVCGVYLAKDPKMRAEIASVIEKALNDHFANGKAARRRRSFTDGFPRTQIGFQ